MTKQKVKSPLVLVKMGELIKSERTKQKMSLKELSEKSFGHPHYATEISKIERAKSPGVTFLTIFKLLKSLEFELF